MLQEVWDWTTSLIQPAPLTCDWLRMFEKDGFPDSSYYHLKSYLI